MEIEALFQRKLMGLRRLPKRERAAARQVAKEERQQALMGLREKRATERRARQALRRLRQPKPA